MNKILKQLSITFIVIGIIMILFFLLLISGLVGDVEVSIFYVLMSAIFLGMGTWGMRNYKRF
ncbi:MAG: hypothetical protein NWQ46_09100 [Spirosomaceae bacterium]|nr:hypothetical protein [Spirosomataceae bacterium]